MKKFMTKAEKLNEVFRFMDCFKTIGVFHLPSFKSNVYECFNDSEKELYDLLWREDLKIRRERLDRSFSKGNDIKYDELIENAFNLLEKSFKEYISDKDGNISLTNCVEYTLSDKLEEIYSLKNTFSQSPEYSGEFFNTGVDIEISNVGTVQKVEPRLSDSGYISNHVGYLEFVLIENCNIEEGLYVFPELNNIRFDIYRRYNMGESFSSLILSISLDTEEEQKLLEMMKVYIDNYELQMKEYNSCYDNEDIRYSVYDVYSMSELL